MSRLTVLAPLALEAWALRGCLPAGSVVRTGMGPRAVPPVLPAGPVVIAGTAGALDPRLHPGDLVVASVVHAPDGSVRVCAAASALVAALRRLGIHASHGPITSRARLVHGRARRELATTGALTVDLESSWLAAAAADRPFAVLRAVVDTDRHDLFHPRTPLAGIRALRAAAPALIVWAASLSYDFSSPASEPSSAESDSSSAECALRPAKR